MRYKYRNVVTGAEIETNSEISAPNWKRLGAEAPVVKEADPAPDPEPDDDIPEEDFVDEDLSGVDDIIKPDIPQEKPKAVKKSAKKSSKKGVRK